MKFKILCINLFTFSTFYSFQIITTKAQPKLKKLANGRPRVLLSIARVFASYSKTLKAYLAYLTPFMKIWLD